MHITALRDEAKCNVKVPELIMFMFTTENFFPAGPYFSDINHINLQKLISLNREATNVQNRKNLPSLKNQFSFYASPF